MNNSLVLLRELLSKKEKEELDELDMERIEVIKCLLTNPESFFELDFETVMGILEFLGVKEEKREFIYRDLISPEAYLQKPKVRNVIDISSK